MLVFEYCVYVAFFGVVSRVLSHYIKYGYLGGHLYTVLLTVICTLSQADQICYAVLCVFSYIAAGMAHKQRQEQLQKSRSVSVPSIPTNINNLRLAKAKASTNKNRQNVYKTLSLL